MSRFSVSVAATLALVGGLRVAVPAAAEPGGRPRMEAMPRDDQPTRRPPSQRDLVDARATLERRFREPLSRAGTAAGANAATSALLDAATSEEDRAVKWLMLTEARRLAAAAGNATAVDRAITLAAAAYEFDALSEEHRTLREIPLRALDAPRAAALAQVAEGLAERAEADGRGALAAESWQLAVRGWQRAGDTAAARRVATRMADRE